MQFVKILRTEDDSRPAGKEVFDFPNPDWSDVEAAIFVMDGDHRSVVMLLLKEDVEGDVGLMGIGGGENGRYFCFARSNVGDEFFLLNPAPTLTGDIQIFAGQMSTVSADEVVDRRQILVAARTWFHAGTLDDSLRWRTG